jgi:hypothetical protein
MYCAIFFADKCSAQEITDKYGYTLASLYSSIRDFRNYLQSNKKEHIQYPCLMNKK